MSGSITSSNEANEEEDIESRSIAAELTHAGELTSRRVTRGYECLRPVAGIKGATTRGTNEVSQARNRKKEKWEDTVRKEEISLVRIVVGRRNSFAPLTRS